MKWDELFNIVKDLEIGHSYKIYEENGFLIKIIIPIRDFKGYDIKKNFQIFIKEGEREFRPNHLRVFIDLNLRIRCRPDLKEELLIAFDNIFYKNDPIIEIEKLSKEKFEHCLNPITSTAILSQLFIMEQEYNYHKESMFEPPTLFYQGWIRQFLDSTKEIDNLCMSVCRFQPPAVKYTRLDNKRHKAFIYKKPPLWYLE